jgi:hypothetical protein
VVLDFKFCDVSFGWMKTWIYVRKWGGLNGKVTGYCVIDDLKVGLLVNLVVECRR